MCYITAWLGSCAHSVLQVSFRKISEIQIYRKQEKWLLLAGKALCITSSKAYIMFIQRTCRVIYLVHASVTWQHTLSFSEAHGTAILLLFLERLCIGLVWLYGLSLCLSNKEVPCCCAEYTAPTQIEFIYNPAFCGSII